MNNVLTNFKNMNSMSTDSCESSFVILNETQIYIYSEETILTLCSVYSVYKYIWTNVTTY